MNRPGCPVPVLLVVAPSAHPLGGVADWLNYLLPGLEPRGWRCILALMQGYHHDVDAYLARHPWLIPFMVTCEIVALFRAWARLVWTPHRDIKPLEAYGTFHQVVLEAHESI